MGYVYLIIIAILFSFGGTWVRFERPYFGSETITFFRFFVGVLFLIALRLIVKKSLAFKRADFSKKAVLWVTVGALAKWGSYLCENYGLSRGESYSNIIVQPIQIITLCLLGVFALKEKLSPIKWGFIGLCIIGALMISWNGRPLSMYIEGNGLMLMGLYIVTGILAAIHIFSQKMLADKLDGIDANLLTFTLAAILAFIPVFPKLNSGVYAGVQPNFLCILAIVMFGFTTGIGFYLNSKAIERVPFYIVPIIQSTMAFFAITWAVLFFHEPITLYIVGGAVIFVIGIIGLQAKK